VLNRSIIFGPFVLQPEAGTLFRSGEIVALGYRALHLLIAFLERPGDVLTKNELIAAAWQGAIVEEANLTVQIATLRKLLGQSSDGQEWIATVPRIGYRFVGPIDHPADEALGDSLPPASREVGTGPSIAVLPFTNLSEDLAQDYFAEGMVEDIITGLSHIKWMVVIARNSSAVYKNRTVDLRQVASELGVRYILEGGVRKAGNRLRITAQLLDATNGAHLWAERFDGDLRDVFDLQDQITDKVVAIVEPNVQRSEIERSRRKRPENLDAYDFYLRAVPFTASQIPEDARIAMRYLEDALRLDPEYVAARALLAWCHEWCFARDGFDEAEKLAALQHARKAAASGTDDATALAIAGFVLTLLSKDSEAGLSAIDRALALNPSCATALYLGGLANALSGYTAPAIALSQRALRLSPFDFLAYEAHLALGIAAVMEDRFEDAVGHYRRLLLVNAKQSTLYFNAAVALVLAGKLDEGRLMAQRGLEIEPRFGPRVFSELTAPAVANKFIDGWNLLGLKE
jgi:adenylate cyclase